MTHGDNEHFHPYVFKYDYELALKKASEDGRVTPDDESLIREFIIEMSATRQLSHGRVNKYASRLIGWKSYISKPYRTVTMADIYQAIGKIRLGNSVKGKPFKQNSLQSYFRILKMFLTWMIENGYSSLPEKKVKAIQVPGFSPELVQIAADKGWIVIEDAPLGES